MNKNRPKTVAVVPAYNVAHILEKAVRGIPSGSVDEVIVVDDASTDDTAAVARSLGAHVITHARNRGYGGAQKTGYAEALRRGADIVVMVHGDNQYCPSYVPQFVAKIRDENFHVVSGTRMILGDALKNGMPVWKFIPNRFLTHLENFVFGTRVTDYHNGYRAYSGEFLKRVPLDLLSEQFDFDTDILIQAAIRRLPVGEVPHPTRYEDDNSQMSFSKGIRYGTCILLTVARFLLHRARLWPQKVYRVDATAHAE